MFQPKSYDHLLGLAGFSDALLTNHFTLYQGYVTNTNKLHDLMKQLVDDEKAATPEYAELKRRFGWEFNGMRLHELYFDNLSKEKSDPSIDLSVIQKITEQFGSFERWQKIFTATGAMRGIGWVILYQEPETGHMFTTWVNEHDGGHLAECKPLLVMDVFEHAFMLDYGLKRADYITAFWNAIDWQIVNKRFVA